MGFGAIAEFTSQVVIGVKGGDAAKRNLLKVQGAATKTKKATDELAGSLPDLAGAFTGLMVVKNIIQIFTSFYDATSKLEMSMNRLKILTNAQGADLERYRRKAFEVAKVLPFDPVEISNGLAVLTQAMGSGTDAMAAMGNAATLAALSFDKLSLERTSQMVGEMARAFGMSGTEAATASAKIFAAAKASGQTVEVFDQTLGRLSMAALRGGQSFDEMLTALAMLKRIEPSSKRAVQGLIRAMGEMGKDKFMDTMKSFGIQTKRASGEIRKFRDIMIDLHQLNQERGGVLAQEALGGARERTMKTLLPLLQVMDQGMRTMEGATVRGADAWNYFDEKLANADATMAQAQRDNLDTTTMKMRILGDAVMKTKIAFGELSMDALRGFARMATPVLEYLSEMSDTTKYLVKGLMLLAGGRGALWLLFASLQGIWRILGVVNCNLSIGATSMGRYAVAATAGWRASAAAELTMLKMSYAAMGAARATGVVTLQTIQLGRAQIALTYTMHAAKAGFAAIVSGAKSVAKSLVVVIGLMEAMELLANPTAWSDKISAYAAAMGQSLSHAVNSRIPDLSIAEAKTFAAAYRKEFDESILFGGKDLDGKKSKWMAQYLQNLTAQRALLKHQEKIQEMFKRNNISAKEWARMQKAAARELYSAMQFGTKKFNAVLDRIAGLNSYEFDVVKTGRLQKVRSHMAKVSSTANAPDDRRGASNSVAMIDASMKILEKYATGNATPDELTKMQSMLSVVGTYGRFHAKHTGDKGFQEVMKRAMEDVINPLSNVGSAKNIEAMNVISRMRRGSTGEMRERGVFGRSWDPATGRYPGGNGDIFSDAHAAGIAAQGGRSQPTVETGLAAMLAGQGGGTGQDVNTRALRLGSTIRSSVIEAAKELRLGKFEIMRNSGGLTGRGGAGTGRDIYNGGLISDGLGEL